MIPQEETLELDPAMLNQALATAANTGGGFETWFPWNEDFIALFDKVGAAGVVTDEDLQTALDILDAMQVEADISDAEEDSDAG